MVTMIVLGLTTVGLLFGTIFGFIRGRDRALLRLFLVLVSAALAITLRGIIVDFIFKININGTTIEETLLEALYSEIGAIPESMQNLIFALLDILLGLAIYFVFLFVIRFLTWLFLFPLLKIIVRKVERRRAKKIIQKKNTNENFENDEYGDLKYKQVKKIVKKHRGCGALIGLFQGVLLAFFLFAPLTGVVNEANKIKQIQLDGQQVLELPDDIGLDEYSNTFIYKVYDKTGHWFFDFLTTTTNHQGKKVSLKNTTTVVVTICDIVDSTITLANDLSILEDNAAHHTEKIDKLNKIGDNLIDIGNSIDELDSDTLATIEDLAIHMLDEEYTDEDLDKLTENLNKDYFVDLGNCIKAITNYEDIKYNNSTITQEEVNDIVNKTYNCLEVFSGIDVTVLPEHKSMFILAIDSINNLTAEDRDSLNGIFGL